MSANGGELQPPASGVDEALADFARTLRTSLRLSEDLPEVLVRRAAADPLFLHMLVARRDEPEALANLLETTPRSLPKWAGPPSPVLILRAAKALLRWGRAGFGEVDAETFTRRREACLRCPHLGSPGAQLVYKVLTDTNNSLCGLCGCAIERKARLPTEECPVAHPVDPGMTLWGEPRS